MTRLTPRLRWSRAVAEATVPASLRPMKASLLALVALMSPIGELHAWREEMVAATGLPVRTLTRHLQQAVDSGWLERVTPGGHGRRSRYRTAIPGESCGPRTAHKERSCGPSTRTQLPEVVGHLAAHSKKKSPRVSEVLAVDDHRGTRPTPDGARGPVADHGLTSGSNDEGPPTGPVVPGRLSVPTAQPQADDVRAEAEARGRALRLAVFGEAES